MNKLLCDWRIRIIIWLDRCVNLPDEWGIVELKKLFEGFHGQSH